MPLELENITSGYNLAAINENFQKIENTWDEKLDRLSSSQGNQMDQDLDLNGNNLINARLNGVPLDGLQQDLIDSVQAAEKAKAGAETARDEADISAGKAANSAVEAKTQADAAEASADRLTGLLTLPVIDWVPGDTATVGTQRYIFENNIYIAPSASDSNPVTLGATPIGDPNWTDWSTPNYVYSYEETVVTPKQVFQLPQNFFEVSDVYVNGIAQPLSAYTVDTSNKTITLDESVPAGTFVKIWTGRPKDDVLNEYADVSSKALSVGLVTKYTAVVSGDVVKPNVAFTDAEISVNGVVQIPGASYSYVIEPDDVDANYNQFRFSEPLPSGSIITGILRKV